MLAPDVNLLVYAHRGEVPEHAAALNWLEATLRSGEPLALFTPVLHGFVRVTTNPRVFSGSSTAAEAVAFINDILAVPRVVVLGPGPRHWVLFGELCTRLALKGGDVSDAALAAMAIEHGCEFASADSDFARFPGLRWHNPLS